MTVVLLFELLLLVLCSCSAACPAWLDEHVAWQAQNIETCNRLTFTCPETGPASWCTGQGFGDQLRGSLHVLRLAAASRRCFHLSLTHGAWAAQPFDNLFQPSRVRWTVRPEQNLTAVLDHNHEDVIQPIKDTGLREVSKMWLLVHLTHSRRPSLPRR